MTVQEATQIAAGSTSRSWDELLREAAELARALDPVSGRVLATARKDNGACS